MIFERSFAKIAHANQQIAKQILSITEARKCVGVELNNAKCAFEVLVAGSEGKKLLKERMERVETEAMKIME